MAEPIPRAAGLLVSRIQGCGYEDGTVVLGTDPDAVLCQFEHGACMTATFGGRTAEFVTCEPTRAKTLLGFMIGASFTSHRTRAAACAIINAVCGFLCISRKLRACTRDMHAPCLQELGQRLGGVSVFVVGGNRNSDRALGPNTAADPDSAGVILVIGDGMASDEGTLLVSSCEGRRRIVFIGPSAAGPCSLAGWEHHCPYGRM